MESWKIESERVEEDLDFESAVARGFRALAVAAAVVGLTRRGMADAEVDVTGRGRR